MNDEYSANRSDGSFSLPPAARDVKLISGSAENYRTASHLHRIVPARTSPVEQRSTTGMTTLSHSLRERPVENHLRRNPTRPLRIMKFGGTSVGDATCIRAVVDIVQTARHDANLVVVVSAMAGVTNRLIEAAVEAELGHSQNFETIFEGLRALHKSSIESLIESVEERGLLLQHMRYCFEEGERLCRGTLLVGELTARVRDAISSLGERLSAPLLAAALAQAGIPSEAIDATQLVVTDSRHGGAEPRMDLTRECCDSRVGPLLRRGILPVITGFIGATREGVLTTLGRGGSDYSATVLGAALDADEVIIWSDVDGLMTADPRLVPGACTIAEISYREAAELAYFGAKVLHPKTLRAVMKRGIPLWIRNTFAPEKAGTKITPDGPSVGGGVKSLTATREVALITVCSHGKTEIPNVLGRTLATTATVRAEVFLISQASSQSDICLVVAAPAAPLTLQALREEFAPDLGYDDVEHITLDPTVAMLTVVGLNMRGKSRIVERTFAALGRGNVDVIAIAQGSSECNLSVVVPKDDMQMALVTTHQEFNLGID